jgi:hypothetical protein
LNKASGKTTVVSLPTYLSPNQQKKVSCYPDFIWQFAQHLKEEYAKKGVAVAVFAKAAVRINGGPLTPFIDSEVDLANEKWDHFRHHSWILPSK